MRSTRAGTHLELAFRQTEAALMVGVILLAVACDTTPVLDDPGAFEKLYVYGVLSPTTAQQTIYLSSTRFENNPMPIDNAQVRIIAPASEVSLAYVGDGIYRDIAGALQAAPGNTYHLRVTLHDGRQISATTTVPANFRVLRPQPGDTVATETISKNNQYIDFTVHWSKSTGGWLTHLIAKLDLLEGSSYAFYDGATVRDSLQIRRGLLGASAKACTIYPAHCDSALSIYTIITESVCEYEYRGRDLIIISCDLRDELRAAYENRSINLEGAFGVFGSAVRDSVRIFFR
jgi:hypothetical protein